jgi:hypothetical protein
MPAPTLTRPTPESYYYSGQGRLAFGDRDPDTGAYSNVTFVGNVTSLTVDLAVDKFEHKESMTGNRSIDLTVIKEKKPTFKFTAESLNKDILAFGLFGAATTTVAGDIIGELATVALGKAVALKHVNVYDVVVTHLPSTVLVLGTDYYLDGEFGTVYPIDSAGVTEADEWSIDYSFIAYDRVDAFLTGTPPEKYVRFEGLNTVTGDLRLIEIPRAAFDPLTGLEFINDELGSGEFSGNILADPFILAAGASQYFTEKRLGPGLNMAP